MTLDSFFEKFELFAEAPNAVAKMRELILDLAVQGGLFQREPSDENVQCLLASNDETRRAIAKYDRRADADNQPLLSAEDRLGIADTWEWRALADLVLFVDYRGKTPTKLSNGIRLLTAKNVRRGELVLSPEEFLSEEDYDTWMTRGLPKTGDVLFTTEAPMGNAAVVNLSERFALAQRVICFQSYGAIDSSFLVLQILSTPFQRLLDKHGTGVTAKGIKASKLRQLPIAVPPLAEQKRIVAKVDELMALCDRLEAQQKERETRHTALVQASLTRFADAPTPTNLEFLFHKSYAVEPAELRKTILTLAVQGKLVFQDADDEPVERMLLRILAEQRLLKRTNISQIRTLAAADRLEYATPDSWQWVTLEDIMIFGPTNGISPKSVEHETPVRSLTLSATTSGRFKPEHCKYIPMELSFDSDLWLQDGDILVQRGNTIDYVGVAAVYHGTAHQFVYPDLMMKFRVSSEVDVDFIHLAMSSDPCRTFLRARASGTSGSMPKINQATLKSLPIPLPPLPEQKRIVAKVEELMGLVDRLEALLSESRERAARLMDAVVAEIARAA